jgi:hypothetical protein
MILGKISSTHCKLVIDLERSINEQDPSRLKQPLGRSAKDIKLVTALIVPHIVNLDLGLWIDAAARKHMHARPVEGMSVRLS